MAAAEVIRKWSQVVRTKQEVRAIQEFLCGMYVVVSFMPPACFVEDRALPEPLSLQMEEKNQDTIHRSFALPALAVAA